MKPTLAVRPLCVVALLVAPVLVPGTSFAAAQKTVHHHAATHHDKAKANPCAANPVPTASALIPAVTGCPTALYALSYIDTQPGTGAPAVAHKYLTVNYTGYLTDGTKFDTSIGKQPITFPYGAHQVITGWDTGFQGMLVGGKRRLYIPYQLAYGEAGRPPVIPAKAELIFDVELVALSDTPPEQQMPAPHPAPPPQPATAANPATTPAQSATPPPTATQTDPNQPKL